MWYFVIWIIGIVILIGVIYYLVSRIEIRRFTEKDQRALHEILSKYWK